MTVWQIWWLALAIKIALLPILPITPDEAYYFAWARHLALSYFDHPPFVAWIMALGLPLWKTSLGIRLPGVLVTHLGFLPWFGILHRLGFSERARVYWILGILLSPLTGLGGFIITPDVPLVFFWGAAMAALLWVFDKPSSARWSVLGALIGLGLLSKYMMILFFPAALLWMLWDGKLAELKRPGPWLGATVALLVFSPVIIWNFQNHFASFAFQSHHGLSDHGLHFDFPLEYVSSQLGLLNPFFAVIGLWVLFKHPKRNKFLTSFAAVPFVFFLFTSFRARVEGNWPVCAYPAFMALVASVVDRENEARRFVPWMKWGTAISSVFVAVIISHTAHPWLPIPHEKDHTWMLREWAVDVPAVRNFHPLFARSYQMAAFHSYYRPQDQEVFKLAGLDRKDFYDFLAESTPKAQAYLILEERDQLTGELAMKYELKNPRVLPSHLVLYDLVPRAPSATNVSSAQVTIKTVLKALRHIPNVAPRFTR